MAAGEKSQDIFARQGSLDKAMEMWATRVWAQDDARSVLRLAPESFKRRMAEMPEEFKNLDEPGLRKLITPTATDNQLRISFWLEYDRVQRELASKMEMTAILRGVITEDYFYTTYSKDLKRIAWVLIPPKSYTVKLTEMLELGLERLRDILVMDPNEKGGKKNTKLMELQLKIAAMMDMRLNGAIAQKLQVEQKNTNLTYQLRGTAQEIQNLVETRNMEDIDKKLEALRKKDLMLSKGVHPDQKEIEVESTVVSTTSEAMDEPISPDS
jgi:hypothetical protein